MQKIIFIILIFLFSLGISQAVFAWDDKTTHPALTNNVIDFYNLNFDPDDSVGAGRKITAQEKEWLIEGSVLEDTAPRWINHFYDPVYNQGWTGEHGPKVPSALLSPEDSVSALNWSQNQELQAKYKLYKGNRTWQRAIYEYVKNDNKKEAFLTLGYVLHLLEDMSVPEHTRNDSHPGDSPLENYCQKFTRDKFYIVDELENQNYEPVILNSLEEYFNYLANYSNNYFFSKDTINDPKYDKPEIIDGEEYAFGLDKNGDYFKLALAVKEWNSEKSDYDIFYLLGRNESSYYPILQGYWSRLSREAVVTVSGALHLFFEEVEKAQEDPSLLIEPPSEKSVIASLFSGGFSITGESFRLLRFFGKTKNKIISFFETVEEKVITSTIEPRLTGGGAAALSMSVQEIYVENNEESESESSEINLSKSNFDRSEVTIEATRVQLLSVSASPISSTLITKKRILPAQMGIPSAPGAGGGGFFIIEEIEEEEELEEETQEEEQEVEQEEQDEQEEEQEDEEEDEEEEIEPPIDTTPPTITQFSVSQCSDSLVVTSCFIATTTVSLAWDSTDEDIDFYELFLDDVIVATTTATSTNVILSNNAVSTVLVKAKDMTGNYSIATSTEVEVFTKPIIINEVAWMGTDASAYDEWIELYNRSSRTINLSEWTLYSQTDEGPNINLENELVAGGYYLIERTDNDTVSDISADWVGPFGNGLNNDGEALILAHGSTIVDSISLGPLPGGASWPAGDSSAKYTMERYDLDTWMTNNDFVKNGLDANNDLINGTPKAKNSVVSQFVLNKNITRDLTIKELNSPCLVSGSSAIIRNGASLNIDPGVTMSFENGNGLFVHGKIIAQGTESQPIIFTSANATSLAGDWIGVFVYNDADSDSIFDHTVFKYAGNTSYAYKRALLYVANIGITITNSIFEYSKIYGLKLENSDSYVSNNIFRNNNNANDAYGINSAVYVIGGSPTFENNTFSQNKRGIYLAESSALVRSNQFQSNTWEAIYSSGKLASFENNSGADNSINGIVMQGNLTSVFATTTLALNSLPYVLKTNSATVLANSTLVIPSGSVFKTDQQLQVYGNLVIDGEDSGDIIFTSLYDDEISGDTTNNATSTMAEARQFGGIQVLSTGSLDARGFTMRYGGGAGGSSGAGITVNGGLADISAAIFDNNYPYGFRAVNSNNVRIENARFENHTHNDPWGTKASMSVENSDATLISITFENNTLGILSDALSTFSTSLISWINNTSTTTPSNLF